MSIFALLAERKIQEAIARGELDDLSLRGQPLIAEDDRDVPAELRMGFKILKNAGMLPPELELRREILSLQDLLAACDDEKEGRALRRRLTEKGLHYRILQERNHRNPGFLQYQPQIEGKLGL